MTEPLLSVQDLRTVFKTDDGGQVAAVEGISFEVPKGKTLAIVGESGCGKSVTALSIMQLLPQATGLIDQGKIVLDGQDLVQKSASEMRSIRGNRISMIFQEPMTALNPVYTVGQQISEVFRNHRNMSKSEARKESIRMLKLVNIPDPERRVDEYPFQLSGGMRQRVMIAIALACEPDLLIADEPTTALDVTIQAQILALMKDLQQRQGTSIVFITHDLGVVAEVADEVIIMYAGKVVERGDVFEIFENPSHPYTKGLLSSIPTLEDTKDKKLSTIEGVVPSLRNLPKGCRFNTRCESVGPKCMTVAPEATKVGDTHFAACHKFSGGVE